MLFFPKMCVPFDKEEKICDFYKNYCNQLYFLYNNLIYENFHVIHDESVLESPERRKRDGEKETN